MSLDAGVKNGIMEIEDCPEEPPWIKYISSYFNKNGVQKDKFIIPNLM